MKQIHHYLRRFAEWATALRARYASDLFFRTTLQVVVLQGVLVAVCVAAFLFSLYNPDQKWLAFGGVVVLSILFGALLARFTLRPARDTLRYQKLFISNVAHELRTPLAVIKTSTEVALIDETLQEDVKATMHDIIIELDRVSEIINNLLSLNNLTRPERMQFQPTDLLDVVKAVVGRHMTLAQERGVRLSVKKIEGAAIVWGNPSALEQIVTNIVKNAVSYTPKDTNGTVTVSIRTQHTEGSDMVVLSVVDTGIGIAEEDMFHIFEPFYRADMSRVRRIKKSGTGLGLTIVNELVRVHHGKIQVQSTKGKGTTVSIALPIAGLPA